MEVLFAAPPDEYSDYVYDFHAPAATNAAKVRSGQVAVPRFMRCHLVSALFT